MNFRSIFTGAVNLVAILVVLGVVSQSWIKTSEKELQSMAVADPPSMEIPQVVGTRTRNLGKSKGSSDPGCVPLYTTPSPTKGKNSRALGSKSKGKGSSQAPVS